MPLFHVEDPASDGWTGSYDDDGALPPESCTRQKAKVPWLRRLLGAGARVRSAIQRARGDPEPRVLREAAEALERDGAVVFARIEGWPRPPVIHGFIPDVYAVFEDLEIVLAFVNEASVLLSPSRRLDAAFASWAAASPCRAYEQIVVPGGRGGRA